MPIIKYIQHDGQEISIDVPVGSSVMQGAVDNMIEGVLGECGGACSCATCHVYVDDARMEKVGAAHEIEMNMLRGTSNVRSNSRLSCQLEVTDDLDGLVVRIPETQY